MPQVHCSQGPLFPRSSFPKVHYAPGPFFPRSTMPQVHCPAGPLSLSSPSKETERSTKGKQKTMQIKHMGQKNGNVCTCVKKSGTTHKKKIVTFVKILICTVFNQLNYHIYTGFLAVIYNSLLSTTIFSM